MPLEGYYRYCRVVRFNKATNCLEDVDPLEIKEVKEEESEGKMSI